MQASPIKPTQQTDTCKQQHKPGVFSPLFDTVEAKEKVELAEHAVRLMLFIVHFTQQILYCFRRGLYSC